MDFELVVALASTVVAAISTAWAGYASRRKSAKEEARAHAMADRLRDFREDLNLTPGEALSKGAADIFGGGTPDADVPHTTPTGTSASP